MKQRYVINERALREFIGGALRYDSSSVPIDASEEISSDPLSDDIVVCVSSGAEDNTPPKQAGNEMSSEKNQIESIVRTHVRKFLQEKVVTEAKIKDPAADTTKKKHKKHNTMADVEGSSFEQIASELGFAVSGAKQAVDKAMQKAQWLGAMHLERPDDIEITILTAMNDYVKFLAKTGELTPEDVQLLKDHPDIVRTLDGFREFLDKYVRRERKVTPKP